MATQFLASMKRRQDTSPKPMQPTTAVGIAFSPASANVIALHPGLIDFVEIAFEQLVHDPSNAQICGQTPVILHCSALNLGGAAEVDPQQLSQVVELTSALRSPWLGEHLAFSRSHDLASTLKSNTKSGKEVQIGFTVCPQLSKRHAKFVAAKIETVTRQLAVPLLVENPPIYFRMPGSDIELPKFISFLCEKTTCGLILDIAHLMVSARNLKCDPLEMLEEFPIDRVTEIHISGCSLQCGIWWDDHAVPADPLAFQLLAHVAKSKRPRAITFEYNWSSKFSTEIVIEHIKRARRLCDG